MSRINRVPRALQSLLGNTAAGHNPDTLLDTVRPGIDLTPYWDAEKIRFSTWQKSCTLPGDAAFLPIPQGESWVPLHIGATIKGFGPGETCSLSCRVYENGSAISNTLPFVQTEIRTFPLGGNEALAVGFSWPQRVLYTSGRIFSVNADVFNAAAARTLICQMMYVRLQN